MAGAASAAALASGASSVRNSIAHASGGPAGPVRIEGGVGEHIAFTEADPRHINVRWEANPDPRPMQGSAAPAIGAAAGVPSNGSGPAQADSIGAFDSVRNWLEKWTFFGLELLPDPVGGDIEPTYEPASRAALREAGLGAFSVAHRGPFLA